MASKWRYSVTLVDSRSLKTTLNYTATFSGASITDEFGLAQVAAADLLTDLEAVTDAAIYSETLTYLLANNEAIPGAGVADITDEMAVVVWLSDVGSINKYHTLRIPAPIEAMIGSDGVTLDETNAAVQAYVANFDTAWEVSDGEHVVVSRENGIESGSWRSRAKSTK